MAGGSGERDRLLKQLAGAIRALASDAADPRLAAAREHQARLETPVRVAIGGEFSSGKSSLVKMMLGAHVVTPGAAASAVPTVRFHYMPALSIRLLKDDEFLEITADTKLPRAELLQYDRMDVGIDLPLLKDLEIYDTPGTSDPNRTEDQIQHVASQVDFVIWCTNATQAWRQSERKLFLGLDETVQKRSLLVVTHVDLPRVKASLGRLMGRLDKEAGPMFHAVVPMDVLGATKSRDAAGQIRAPETWRESGGEHFLATLQEVTGVIRAPWLAAAEAFLRENALEDSGNDDIAPVATQHESPDETQNEAPVAAKPEITPAPDPDPASNPGDFAQLWAERYGEFRTVMEWPEPTHDDEVRTYVLDLLRSFGAMDEAEATEAEMNARLAEAAEYLEAAEIDTLPDGFAPYAKAALAQLDWEFEQLAKTR